MLRFLHNAPEMRHEALSLAHSMIRQRSCRKTELDQIISNLRSPEYSSEYNAVTGVWLDVHQRLEILKSFAQYLSEYTMVERRTAFRQG